MPTLPIPTLTSTAKLLKMRFDGHDLAPLRGELLARCQESPADAAALIDLSTIEQMLGRQEAGLQFQARALHHHTLYRSSWPASPQALRVLTFMTSGDLSANTPIDFLLQGSDVVLYLLYIVPGTPLPNPVPEHDIAIVIAGEADQVRPVMDIIRQLIPAWPCPVLNQPDRIMALSRTRMFRVLEGIPGLVVPPTVRIDRSDLESIGHERIPVNRFLTNATFPVIVRTIDSHAGKNLAKLDTAEAIMAYLADHPAAEFFISPYVDYKSPDGMFRKYRIIWVDGRPFPCHMAIANEWKVWYLNADMAASIRKRAEEAYFMSYFDTDLGRRHAAALHAIAQGFGLEYVGIDCAEMPDGRLLVFEADVALVAHDMDPPDLYPYKGPQMRKLFTAFYDMLKRKSRIASATTV